MIGPMRAIRVYAWTLPCDLRKGYNGLFGLVVSELGRDPCGGDYFVFVNRRRTACKILCHDGTGLCIFMKRLDKGRFPRLWRANAQGPDIELTPSELHLFLEGCQQVGYQRLAP